MRDFFQNISPSKKADLIVSCIDAAKTLGDYYFVSGEALRVEDLVASSVEAAIEAEKIANQHASEISKRIVPYIEENGDNRQVIRWGDTARLAEPYCAYIRYEYTHKIDEHNPDPSAMADILIAAYERINAGSRIRKSVSNKFNGPV